VSNLFRFEIANNEIKALTNAETGYFRPIPRPDGSCFALEYSGTGFVPTVLPANPIEDLGAITFLGSKIAEKHPIVKSWNAGSPAAIPLDSLVTGREKYVPLKQMKPDGGYPIVLGYRDSVALGYQYGFADPLHCTTSASRPACRPTTRWTRTSACTCGSISRRSTGISAIGTTTRFLRSGRTRPSAAARATPSSPATPS
jgi:hypothetical protein